MGFTMTTHQIWSCHVILATNFENVYFLPNSILNFRKSYQIWGNWLKNKKLQAKKKLGVGTPPPPSAYRVKLSPVFQTHGKVLIIKLDKKNKSVLSCQIIL